MTKRKPPKFGSYLVMDKPGIDAAPRSPIPYYAQFGDGLFLQRELLIGRAMVRQATLPKELPKLGHYNGMFEWDAPPIPAKLCAQITHFFRRIYEKQKTEAEVILTMHEETREWRVFVPTQNVSHGGVTSVMEHNFLEPGWMVVGTMHSHCNFGAFHSGTDTGDADEMDGVHLTIGMILQDMPQIVCMVSVNKQRFHYNDKIQKETPVENHIADFSEVGQHEAPEWWDQYVGGPAQGGSKPVGYELFEIYKKSTVVKEHVKPTTTYQRNPEPYKPGHQNWPTTQPNRAIVPFVSPSGFAVKPPGMSWDDWDILRKAEQAKARGESAEDKKISSEEDWDDQYMRGNAAFMEMNGYAYDEKMRTWRWVGHQASQKLKESEEFNQRGWRQTETGIIVTTGGFGTEDTTEEEKFLDAMKEDGRLEGDFLTDDYWETALGKDFMDVLFDSLLLSDEDLEWAISNPTLSATKEAWAPIFQRKMLAAATVLSEIDSDLNITIGKPSTKKESAIQPGEGMN